MMLTDPTTLALHDVARAAQVYLAKESHCLVEEDALTAALTRLHATGWRADGPEPVEARAGLTGAGNATSEDPP